MSHRCQNCKRVVRKPEAIKACQCPYCNDRWAHSEPTKPTPGPKAAIPSKA